MFNKLKKKLRLGWMRVQIAVRREVLQDKDPAAFLYYCAQAILKNPDFDLLPSNRKAVIYAPKRAKQYTEILAIASEALANDTSVKAVYDLGPFRNIDALGFLNTETGCINNGKDHILHHVAVIEQFANYLIINNPENLHYHAYNRRTLLPMVEDFQHYVDSILKLYDHNH